MFVIEGSGEDRVPLCAAITNCIQLSNESPENPVHAAKIRGSPQRPCGIDGGRSSRACKVC